VLIAKRDDAMAKHECLSLMSIAIFWAVSSQHSFSSSRRGLLMNLLPPPPAGDADRQEGPDSSARKRPNSKPKLPSVDELLDKILKLSGPLLMGLMTTSQANIILKTLKIALDMHTKSMNQQAVQGLPHEVLIELLKSRPELVKMLEPYLSDEQVQWILGQEADGDEEA
jgi:hypothetical protein